MKKNLWLVLMILSIVSLSLSAQPDRETAESEDSAPEKELHNDMMGNAADASYQGTWACEIDEKDDVILVLKVELGNMVTGVFTSESGNILGNEVEIKGETYMHMGLKIMEGTWSNSEGESGWLQFDIADDGSSFYGSWGYGDEHIEGHSWNGKKAGD